MTVESQKRRQIVNGTGGLGPYPFTDIPLYDAEDDMAVFIELNDGSLTDRFIINVDYTLTYSDETLAGSVTFFARNVETDEKVVMVRETEITQTIKLSKSGTIDTTNYEDMVDKTTLQNIDQQDELDRSLRVSTAQIGDFDAEIRAVTNVDAGKAVVVNDDGDGFDISDTNVNDIDDAVEDAQNAALSAQASASSASSSASSASTSAIDAQLSADSASNSADAAAASAAEADGVPLGHISQIPADVVSTGYLPMNGQTVTIETYPEFVEKMTGSTAPGTTYTIPNLNGVGDVDSAFVRGWNASLPRAVGEFQLDAMQPITGSISRGNVYGFLDEGGLEGAFVAGDALPQRISYQSGASNAIDLDSSLVTRTADETRPRNFSMLFVIKVFGAANVSGSIDLEGLEVQVSENTAKIDSQLITGYFHVRDERPNGTNAGTSVVGIQTRELNTVVTNPLGIPSIAGASLSSNQITLPAGTYKIKAVVPSLRSEHARGFLYNVTDDIEILRSTNNFSGETAFYAYSQNILDDVFTIDDIKVLEIRQYLNTASANTGLGAEVFGGSGNEIYTDVRIEKIGD